MFVTEHISGRYKTPYYTQSYAVQLRFLIVDSKKKKKVTIVIVFHIHCYYVVRSVTMVHGSRVVFGAFELFN